MKKTLLLLLAIFLLSIPSGAGEKVKNFTLTDVSGKKHSLEDYKSSKAIVLMFIATQCPVSNAYNDRMVEIYNDYSGKGVTVLGINANKQESVDEIVSHAKDHGFKFPILKDVNNVVADQLEASVTPEIYVLTGSLELLYHGRIDDSQKPAGVKSKDLRVALDELLAGKAISSSRTKAFGCTIKRVS